MLLILLWYDVTSLGTNRLLVCHLLLATEGLRVSHRAGRGRKLDGKSTVHFERQLHCVS